MNGGWIGGKEKRRLIDQERGAVATDDGSSLGERGSEGRPTASYIGFVAILEERLKDEDVPSLSEVGPLGLYAWAKNASLAEEELAEMLSEYCGIPFVARIEDEDVEFRTLAKPFCQAKLVVPVRSVGARQTVALSNPFDWGLLEDLERTIPRGRHLALLVAAPRTLKSVLSTEGVEEGDEEEGPEPSEEDSGDDLIPTQKEHRAYDPDRDPGKNHPVAKLAIALLAQVLEEEATALVLEPRRSGAVARASIRGRSYDLQDLSLDDGKKLVSRFKALSGMDVAKKRTPQKGSLEILLKGKVLKLRVSTAPSASFEHLTVRVLDPSSEARPLEALGLAPDQRAILLALARRDQGLILFVGPLGSGKTTTIYSLLAEVAQEARSVVTVEDPIEHKIPFATQQEVGPEADASGRALLHRAFQEEPDVLFLSEIRDLVSARSCMEFTSLGHLTVTSMNSSNAATAVFRLERMGVNRGEIADALILVVAQRLLDRLCPECREVRPITPEEADLLRPFTSDIPAEVAHPGGCSACRGTGYRGQEGVFEVIRMGPRMAELVREGRPISELRDFAQARGDLLLSDHGIEKLRELVFPVEDVYREVLLEEGALFFEEAEEVGEPDGPGPEGDMEREVEEGEEEGRPSLSSQRVILVVEDEESTLFLLDQILSKAGYRVIKARDGGDALLKLVPDAIDLILSDIHMPNLDGLKLMEILNQHGIDIPVILLTGEPSPEVEARGREMGVADYLRKPIQRDLLLNRIEKALEDLTF